MGGGHGHGGGGHGHGGGGFGPGNFGYGYGYPGGYDGDVIVVVPPPAPAPVAPCKSSLLHKCPKAVGDYTVGGYSLTTIAVVGVAGYLLYHVFGRKK